VALAVFRRRIRIQVQGDAQHGEARAALEDDFHHFRVRIQVLKGQVSHTEGVAVRRPYTRCGEAGEQLQALVGMPLNTVSNAVTRVTDARLQCTHQFDLAGLAIATLARGEAQRDYAVAVPRRVNGRTQLLLDRDGAPCLQWQLQDDVIEGPAPFVGVSLREGFARWALQQLDETTAEAALVLRRCAVISLGRTINLDERASAMPWARCFVEQPERAPTALRMVGSTWDFSERPRALLADDLAWLQGGNLPALP
jgi:hypothetical protein